MIGNNNNHYNDKERWKKVGRSGRKNKEGRKNGRRVGRRKDRWIERFPQTPS